MNIKELKKNISVKKIDFQEIIKISNTTVNEGNYPEAKNIPNATGIYIFFNDLMEPMYIGKSTELRARYRTHFSDSNSKVFTALKQSSINIRYYTYALCKNNRDAEMYEMIYTSLYNPKLVDMTIKEINNKKVI